MTDRSSPEVFPEDVVPNCKCGARPIVMRYPAVGAVTIWCAECKRSVLASTAFQSLAMWEAIRTSDRATNALSCLNELIGSMAGGEDSSNLVNRQYCIAALERVRNALDGSEPWE